MARLPRPTRPPLQYLTFEVWLDTNSLQTSVQDLAQVLVNALRAEGYRVTTPARATLDDGEEPGRP